MGLNINKMSKTTKIVILAEFFLVAYLLYILTVSIYKSYQIDIHIKNYEAENERTAAENRKKSEDFEYYSSNTYMEKMAKQNLGLVNPGEEVIIIPKSSTSNNGVIGDNNPVSASNTSETQVSVNNSQRWWKFFFDMKR